MIDTHCHLNLSPLQEDALHVRQLAQQQGVTELIVIGTDISTSKEALSIASSLPKTWASLGIHPDAANPQHAIDAQQIATWKEQLTALLPHEKVVAIGECGLDYVDLHNASKEIAQRIKNQQKQLFGMQIQLAKSFHIPLSIHCRNTKSIKDEPQHSLDAYTDLIDTLEHFSKDDGVIPTFVLHCMSGNLAYLQSGLRLGGYISFAGNITYSSAGLLRELLHNTPHDRILLETDAPFLSPQSKRGTPNTPGNIKETYEFVANELEISFLDLEEMVISNAKNIFHLTA